MRAVLAVSSDLRLWGAVVVWRRQGCGWCGTLGRESVCACARACARPAQDQSWGDGGGGGQPERPHAVATDPGAKPPVAVRPWEGKVSQDPSSSQELACDVCRTERGRDSRDWEIER